MSRTKAAREAFRKLAEDARARVKRHRTPGPHPRSLAHLLREVTQQGRFGFLDEQQLAQLADQDRLRQVLVRCNSCRFTCPAQDAEYLVALIDSQADQMPCNYVRDVALVAGDRAFAGDYSPVSGPRQVTRPPVPKPTPKGQERAQVTIDDGAYISAPYDVDATGRTISDALPGF